MQKIVFRDIKDGKPVSRYNAFFQRLFVNNVLIHVDNRANHVNGIGETLEKLLLLTESEARAAVAEQRDYLSKSHFTAIADMIEMWHTGKDTSYLDKIINSK